MDNLDEVIATIRASRDRDAARVPARSSASSLSDIQAAGHPATCASSQLTALEAGKIKHRARRHARADRRAARDPGRRAARPRRSSRRSSRRSRSAYGDERRTHITHSEDEIDIEDLIADQQMVITITKSGYIKSLPLATYRQQHRGGRGVTGMDMKDGDYIEHLFVTSSHDFLLFFSNRGKVYRSKVYELPEASRTAKGRALVNVLPLRDGERIQSVLSTRDFTEGKYLVFATQAGRGQEDRASAPTTRRSRPTASSPSTSATMTSSSPVRRTSGDDDILMVSRKGQAVRFHEDGARAMGRDTSGVRGMDVERTGRRRARDGRRPRRPGAARRDRERLRQAHRRSTSTARPTAAPRASGRSS